MKISTLFLRLVWVWLFIFIASLSYTQAPYSFNYQGLARDDSGAPLKNKTINLKISLLQGTADGTVQFQEEQSTNTNDRGLFAIRIGEGNALVGSLSSIDWSSGTYFIRVEMDPNGGQNFINLGSSQLYSVPYAIYALNSGSAGSTGGSQNLTLDGSILSIEGGNSVDLGGLEDADADPENELQDLSINGNVLHISGGSFIDLPVGSSLWKTVNNDAVYEDGGSVMVRKNGQRQVRLSSDDDGGFWYVYDEAGNIRLSSYVFENGAGFLGTTGPNGSRNIRLSVGAGNPNRGFLGVADETGDTKVSAFVSEPSAGVVYTEGPSGKLNTRLTYLADHPEHGFIGAYDADGSSKTGMYVDAQGNGRLFADFVDNFVDNPEKSGEKVVYTMIQGPESATYLRGTSKMENGTAFIDFPSHFSSQILSENITVLITPLSADSKGIAVIKKGKSGFAVQELLQGKGNYEFDWEVKGVRRNGTFKAAELPRIPDQSKSERTSHLLEEEMTKEEN